MIDLTWGESVAVRQQFVSGVRALLMPVTHTSLLNLNYSPFEGDPQLIKHTKDVIKRQVGRDYKYVIMTNGAAGGCVIAMRAYAAMGFTVGMTPQPPFFSLYPAMVKASGLRHEPELFWSDPKKTVYLVDSPSNPQGIVRTGRDIMPVIWDAVYGNNVYETVRNIIPHDVLVGSYSKLTGLNGIRIGWIATNDSILFEHIKPLVSAEYCGLSSPSVNILNQILPNYDWEAFELLARCAMDKNREEWTKLEKFFQGESVSENGMFYYGPMDQKCKELFEKANVLWTPSTKLGTFYDDHGRFNIGQSLDNVKNAVANVLRSDSLR